MERAEVLKELGKWIEKEADKIDYAGEDWEGPAWMLYPNQVEALKRGEMPEREVH